jgi:fatty-acyl-CoA synthase
VHTGMLLAMAANDAPDRLAVGPAASGLPFAELAAQASRAASYLRAAPGERVGLIGQNSATVPVLLFAAGASGKPFVPLNYRLPDHMLRAVAARLAPATVVVDDDMAARVADIDGIWLLSRDEFQRVARDERLAGADLWSGDPEGIAVQIFTSGTSGEPKAAVLRHRNVTSYVISTVEYLGAGEDECALISVPPYHIAGISAVLTATYAGRRVVQLPGFSARDWIEIARREQVTHAMIVPTMMDRILDEIEAGPSDAAASLRSMSYGGGPMPLRVIERAMRLLPGVDFVNGYGLTETSSTIALLGPDEHRAAAASADPRQRALLGSVGRPLPGVEITIRDADGSPVGPDTAGEIWVRGEQVSSEYVGRDRDSDDCWFHTRDGGYLDADGYLFVTGRLDDVIVRGGENLSPGEIEAVLTEHPAVAQAAVVGLPDHAWGEKVAAVVVPLPGMTIDPAQVQEFVRARLRSTMTPELIEVRGTLPFSETGKLLRRTLRDELTRR